MASRIVETVLEQARKCGAKKVLEVNLVIGKLTLLGLDQVRFSYEILSKDTVLEGSKLNIKEGEPKARCLKCGYEGPIKYRDDPIYQISLPTLVCPKCGDVVEIVEGKECEVRSIRIEK